jgi:hypothetical protein
MGIFTPRRPKAIRELNGRAIFKHGLPKRRVVRFWISPILHPDKTRAIRFPKG